MEQKQAATRKVREQQSIHPKQWDSEAFSEWGTRIERADARLRGERDGSLDKNRSRITYLKIKFDCKQEQYRNALQIHISRYHHMQQYKHSFIMDLRDYRVVQGRQMRRLKIANQEIYQQPNERLRFRLSHENLSRISQELFDIEARMKAGGYPEMSNPSTEELTQVRDDYQAMRDQAIQCIGLVQEKHDELRAICVQIDEELHLLRLKIKRAYASYATSQILNILHQHGLSDVDDNSWSNTTIRAY